jgi:hypothetical protein
MYPLLIAKRYDKEFVCRLIHSDFIMHDLHVWPVISTHHSMDCYAPSRVIVTSIDMPKFIVGAHHTLSRSYSDYEPTSLNIKDIALECYDRCKGVGHKWTVVTGADDLIYKLCAAIANVLFFATKIEYSM